MSAESLDVCVITTIHANFDARIFDRGIRVCSEAGMRVGFVGPWPYHDESGVAPSDWHVVPRARSRLTRPFAAARTFFRARQVRARVFHFHDLDFLPWALLLRATTSALVVYDVHENYPEDILYHKNWIPRALRRPLSTLVRVFEEFAARHLDAAVVVVPHLQERFSGYGVRTEVVRNFSRIEARPDLPHAKALLYSGGITRFYGSSTLLEIARELKRRGVPYPLVIVDKFAEADLKPLFESAIEHECLPIRIIPQVPASELYRIMQHGAVGLVPDVLTPSTHLGVHGKFFDYMALGLPIVASDIPNARELITMSGNGVLVPSDDPSAFVDAAVDLLRDPERLARLRENGVRAYREHFSWKTEAAKLPVLLRDLTTTAAGGSPQE
jgi:glycosyltransferase involved in cell wall biosynthesis